MNSGCVKERLEMMHLDTMISKYQEIMIFLSFLECKMNWKNKHQRITKQTAVPTTALISGIKSAVICLYSV